jgi:hypothetical protein
LPIRIVGAIGRSAAMAPDLPAHCRRRPGRGRWLSHGSMSRMRFLAKCPRALSRGALDQSAGGRLEQSLREATTHSECSYGLATGTPNLMQLLPRLPSPPDISSLPSR